MKIKKILLDLDGTVIDRQGNISLAVVKKLKETNEKISISFCTGRFADFVNKIALETKVMNNHIVEGGSRVIDSQGKTLWCKFVSNKIVKEVVSLGKKYGFKVAGSVNGETKNHLDGTETNLSQIFPYELNEKQVGAVFDHIKSPNVHVMKVWHDPIKGSNLGITHKDGTKRNGINFLLQHEKILPENVACICDGDNDIPMFELAEYKVAMGNASTQLKLLANYITPAVETDGVIDGLNKIISLNSD